MNDFIPMDACLDRGVYEIRARNFSVGVFSAEKRGFIGIRQKFDSRYLFTEYHHDESPVVGTARPVRLLGMVDDQRIKLWESYPGPICMYCGEPAEYREELKGVYDPALKDFTSWPWVHAQENPDCTGRVEAMGRGTYRPLYSLLEDYEEMLADEREQEDA